MTGAVVIDAVRTPLISAAGSVRSVRSAGVSADRMLDGLIDRLLRRQRISAAEIDGVILVGRASTRYPVLRRSGCGHGALADGRRWALAGGPGGRAGGGLAEGGGLVVVATVEPERPAVARRGRDSSGRAIAAELLAARYGLGRAELDAYARRSCWRAREVAAHGEFDQEIVPVVSETGVVAADELPARVPALADLAGHRPRFYDPSVAGSHPEIGWVLTEGNTYRPAAGACALLVGGQRRAAELGLGWQARIGAAETGLADVDGRLDSAIAVTGRVLGRTGVTPADLDHCEVDEAFAPVPLAWEREFGVPGAVLNSRGGAISLGHLGRGSALRSLITMLHALDATDGRHGLYVMTDCGLTHAIVLERTAAAFSRSAVGRGPAAAARQVNCGSSKRGAQ